MMKNIPATIFSLIILGAVSVQAQTSLSLDRCLELARSNDPYVKNASLDLLAARAQRSEARAEYFPTVSATALAFHSLYPFIDLGVTDILGNSDAAWNISNFVDELAYSNGLSPRYKALQYGYGASLSLMQPIYAGGRIANGNRLAQLGVEAAELQGSLRTRETLDQVEQKYWTVVGLVEKGKVVESAMNLLKNLEKDVASAVDAGLATESDMLSLKLRQSELKSAELKLRNGIRLAKMDLFNSIGVQYSAVSACSSGARPFIDEYSLEDDLENLPAPDTYWVSEEELAASTEESRLLELQVRAKSLEKKMAMGAALPQFALGGAYGYGHYLGDGKGNGTVFAMLTVPISDWGKTSKKLKRYEYEKLKAENERDYLGSQLILKARKLWMELDTAWEQISVSEDALNLARDAYGKRKSACEAGMSTLSELLQAEAEVINCEDAYVESRIAYRTALDSYISLSK